MKTSKPGPGLVVLASVGEWGARGARSRASRDVSPTRLFIQVHFLSLYRVFSDLNAEANAGELKILRKIYDDLEARSPGAWIDQSTFRSFMDLPGILGENLFQVLDRDGDGVFTFDEFADGLARCYRGSLDEKLELLFSMFSRSKAPAQKSARVLSQSEVSTLLHSFLTPEVATRCASSCSGSVDGKSSPRGAEGAERAARVSALSAECSPWDRYDAKQMISLDECAWVKSSWGDGSVTLVRFRAWLELRPRVVGALESLFQQNAWGLSPLRCACKGDLGTKLAGADLQRPMGSPSLDRGSAGVMREDAPRHRRRHPDLRHAAQQHEGWLHKPGRKTSLLQSRWCMIWRNFFYEFRSRRAKIPSRVIFIKGCFVNSVDKDACDDDSLSIQRHAFRIAIRGRTPREYMASSCPDRKAWISAVRLGGQTVPIHQFYTLGREIGRGRWSRVHVATRRDTGERVAVKVVDRSLLCSKDTERCTVQTEVAVLRLVRHPHIIRMRGVFEVLSFRNLSFLLLCDARGTPLTPPEHP